VSKIITDAAGRKESGGEGVSGLATHYEARSCRGYARACEVTSEQVCAIQYRKVVCGKRRARGLGDRRSFAELERVVGGSLSGFRIYSENHPLGLALLRT